ncbi:MAG: FAD-dependent oxidoreductase [Gemmataceae bacterium]
MKSTRLAASAGKCTDASGIQFRMLNASKGPAMHSPRAQCDKKLYQFTMKPLGRGAIHLTLRQELSRGCCLKPLAKRRRAVGVVARGDTIYRAEAVILTTGTFLKAIMHTGEAKTVGGLCRR